MFCVKVYTKFLQYIQVRFQASKYWLKHPVLAIPALSRLHEKHHQMTYNACAKLSKPSIGWMSVTHIAMPWEVSGPSPLPQESLASRFLWLNPIYRLLEDNLPRQTFYVN